MSQSTSSKRERLDRRDLLAGVQSQPSTHTFWLGVAAWVALVAANALDWLSTVWGLQAGLVEQNPAALWAITEFGVAGFAVSKVAVLLVAVVGLYALRDVSEWAWVFIPAVMAVLTGYVALQNTVLLLSVL